MIESINVKRLNSGVKKLDADIDFLLSFINNDINRVIKDGRILCKKVDEIVEEVLALQDDNIKETILATLERVRNTLTKIYKLDQKLKRCKTLSECEEEINSSEEKLVINSFTFSILLNKCRGLSECEYVISKYSNGLNLEAVSLNTILKVLLKDNTIEESLKKELITLILRKIDKIGLSLIDENYFIRLAMNHPKYANYIYDTINGLGLINLYFLNEYLVPKKEEPIKSIVSSTGKTSIYDKRLAEAKKGGLEGSFARMYASGALKSRIGGGGRHRKKGSNFGR